MVFGFPESGDSFPAKSRFGRVCASGRDGPCVPSLALCMPAKWLQCSWGWLKQHLGLFQFRDHHHSSFFHICNVHLKECPQLIQILDTHGPLFFSALPLWWSMYAFQQCIEKYVYSGQLHFKEFNQRNGTDMYRDVERDKYPKIRLHHCRILHTVNKFYFGKTLNDTEYMIILADACITQCARDYSKCFTLSYHSASTTLWWHN